MTKLIRKSPEKKTLSFDSDLASFYAQRHMDTQRNISGADALKRGAEQLLKDAGDALTDLFEAARQKNELQFVFALNPEFRGTRGPGWNSAEECFVAMGDYVRFLNDSNDNKPELQRLRIRVALAYYCHVSEASGFYEVPKNMLRVAEGKNYIITPFMDMVESHKVTGDAIAPNANKILKDLIGHCYALAFKKLAGVLNTLFDSDLRNGFAHADYVIWDDGIRLTKRNGGIPRIVPYDEFNVQIGKAVGFFETLADVRRGFLEIYNPPKTFRGKLGDAPETDCTVSYVPGVGLSIQC
jgi:hypothetical protein